MVTLVRSDLEFILEQIRIAERHAAGEELSSILPNTAVPWGLRTVDGTFNNLVYGRDGFGAADNLFPRLVDPVFLDAEVTPPEFGPPVPTSYAQTSGNVFDSAPRTISNLIVDQSVNNPAAYAQGYDGGADGIVGDDPNTVDDESLDDVLKEGVVRLAGDDGIEGTSDDFFKFSNTAPDEGLSAPFNSWFTFFGQFFDHGLDLVTKGNNGTIFIPLQPDDPLFSTEPGAANFLVVTRTTQFTGPGVDGILGNADDTTHEALNTTSPFVDQNQTYSSHPSHQVFLRAYELGLDGKPYATGGLITNKDLGVDGTFGTVDDVELGGMATWAVVKAQARDILGINLTDADVGSIPLLATDPYGNFIRGTNGFVQVVMDDGVGGTVLVEGNPAAPIDLTDAIRTGHGFLDDIAHSAAPRTSLGVMKAEDADGVAGVDDLDNSTYDNELLDAHYIAGDGRVNENIGLTAVHHVFHSEHNRLLEQTKATVLATGDVAFLNEWLRVDVAEIPVDLSTLQWDGERLFQAAKFGTEMQYQHLVFEEFARKIQPNVDAFLVPEGYDATINAAITAEFAHTVYRFGHSMLTENINRLDPSFASSEIGLVEAFLNPLEFAAGGTSEEAAGAIIRGLTRDTGNQIDEFVTEALRNNLLGLPLDLASINLARGRDTGIPSLNAARRSFFETTGDTQLKAYISWADFAQGLKHPESLINFIAAYGTHAQLTAPGVDTLAEKRSVAAALVLGGDAIVGGLPVTIDEEDRLAFLHSTGDYANLPSGVTTTGVDAIDFWIGGLAEEIMPFGGMLGSTFNFVFESQMEALQNGDRFYYLSRLAGTSLVTALENNSFSKIIMANTDITRLPADAFSNPGLILEVDQALQFNEGLGSDDPVGDSTLLTPLVLRDDPGTEAEETHYLKYTGDDHVVLGGTADNDTMIASIGDDTLWGDGGDDRLEGGDGNDTIEGGAGDDIITDRGGDDVLKGNDGNDVISGGNGLNLIMGGDGKDFIITGEDVTDTFAGAGDDFVLGSQMNLPTFGNEGNDWIEIGTSDGAAGDNFDPAEGSPIIGHDVFITGGGFDEVDGEGGDDIMVFSDGEDHFNGGGGFDWASYKNETSGVTVDLLVNDFIEPPVAGNTAGVLDRFAEVEGLSGSSHSDVLRGDDADAAQLGVDGNLNGTLIRPELIEGVQAILNEAIGVGTTTFGAGNIILGGDGSDFIEGRGGDDILDGDRSINVRIVVHETQNMNSDIIDSADGMAELIPQMLDGTYNPGQLEIKREILDGDGLFNYDTAVFSGTRAQYDIVIDDRGNLDANDDLVIVSDLVAGRDGTDRLLHMERLQFSDQAVILPGAAGLNASPVGALSVSGIAQVGQTLTAFANTITDADNVTALNATGLIVGVPAEPRSVAYVWQAEFVPGSGVFEDIVDIGGGNPATAEGRTFRVTPDLDGLLIRARAVYEDAHGVIETVYSGATAAVAAGVVPPVSTADMTVTAASDGVRYIRGDLQFILDQIIVAERNAAGETLSDILPNSRVPFGLRTVDGSFNNLVPGRSEFGASDNPFPRLVDPVFLDADPLPFDPDGLGPLQAGDGTSHAQTSGFVFDSAPRTISNLVSDQTANNRAAYVAAYDGGDDGIVGDDASTSGIDESIDDVLKDGVTVELGAGLDQLLGTADDVEVFQFNNTTPDEGLSAPFNSWMTFFGQFFDHGLDLVTKGNNGTIFIPLQPDDPLFSTAPGAPNFLVVTRTTQVAGPGADGIMGTLDDTTHEATNTTSPFVDQNQTYSSHPSHQVFLRAYEIGSDSAPHSTGGLITNRDLVDGIFGNGNDIDIGGMATWAVVKAQARDILGINLTDANIGSIPLLATDAYGNFIPGLNGFPQVVFPGNVLVEGNPAAPISVVGAVSTGHAFLDDIAHSAAPAGKTADADSDVGLDNGAGPLTGVYDDELLDAHYIAGDGRVNENIGLTTVHHVFHAEHNRLLEHTKQVVLATNDVDFLNQWLRVPVSSIPVDLNELEWNGERLFQAAKFGTEMQYQHLVFEEFGRRVQPQIDLFLGEGQGYDTTIDPSIVAEFAHTVYRFGHSMLTETIDRLDVDFVNSEIGLVEAFLNPLAFANGGATPDEAAGAIIRGVTRQVGNEIDEFVTEALRNNLLGLPLDLPAINMARGRDTGIPSLNAARREFYTQTGDTQLKPYSSWADLVQNLKHPESLINFIAAYGTHAALIAGDVNTLAEMRAVASALVFGGTATINEGELDERVFIADDTDRLAFLNGTGAYVNGPNGVTTTGVDNIDFWIGGLAEKQMPFGGMLGSTFNFVFENQMEKLQNGDRFYYLERTAGLNFLTELENNTFARLIMANTDVDRLPGDVFSTPAYTLEVDIARQHTGLGLGGDEDPEGDSSLLTPLVIRDNPLTDGPDDNYLQYTGDDHVVLGGTESDDIIIASIGDDTVYGDGGNDRLEGGDGVDKVFGGAGDDIITDKGGEDILQGGDGNDAIHGGNSIDLILGGHGNDFIVTGEDGDESFGGTGNDFILGDSGDEFVFGNEGDDWIERGMFDGSAGENFDTRGLDLIIGHDVFIGDSIGDRMNGEGGDDIMNGNGGQGDRYMGGSGFDWAMFKHETLAAQVDLELRAVNETPVPQSIQSIMARYDSVEGVSGSQFGDILKGDELDAAGIAGSGAQGSVLKSEYIGMINGLQTFLDALVGGPVDDFSAGNIILGGQGSDVVEGRGGDDLLDGDARLNVRIAVDAVAGDPETELFSADSMTELQTDVFAGLINPNQLRIVREIIEGDGDFNFDTAVFRGLRADYTVETIDDNETVGDTSDDIIRVTDNVAGRDGVDTLRNFERLQFSDESVELVAGLNAGPVGLLSILDDVTGDPDDTPVEGQRLRVSIDGVTDADNLSILNPLGAIDGTVLFVWQVETVPASGVFEDIVIATGLGDLQATGETFDVTPDVVGLVLRVKATYQDGNGVIEQVFSAPTEPVENINFAPQGTVGIAGGPAIEDGLLTALPSITDADGLTGAVFTYEWQQSSDGGANWAPIVTAVNSTFAPGQEQVGSIVRVVVSYTDDQGTLESVPSAATDVVDNVNDLPFGDVLLSTETPASGQEMNAIIDFTDEDGTLSSIFAYQWQAFDGSNWLDIDLATNEIYTPTLVDVGSSLRVVVNYEDDLGQAEEVISAASEAVLVGNALPVGSITISDTTPTEGQSLTATPAFTDADGLVGVVFTNQWQQFDGLDWIDIVGATTTSFTPTQDQVNAQLRFVVTYTDNGGAAETVASDPTIVVGDFDAGTAAIDLITGTDGQDILNGAGGRDTIDGGAENDIINGGAARDTLNGDAGDDVLTGGGDRDVINGGDDNDTINYTIGDGIDTIDGGAGSDTVVIVGTAAANTLNVVFDGATITAFEGSSVTAVEAFTASLLGGNDTLSYNPAGGVITTANVNVNLAAGTASGFTSIAGIENVVGGTGDDTLRGNNGANTLNGGLGNDRFVAAIGDGSDTYLGGVGSDTLDLSLTTAAATVTTTQSTSAQTGTDNLTSIENIIGSQGGDTINLGAGVNVIDGRGGIDIINAGGGADTITGGAGNDIMNGGAGNDTFIFATGFGADTIGGFDAIPGGGQDRLFLDSSLGINAGNFAGSVSIAASGADTLITIGANSILLTGVASANVTVDDFLFGGP